MKLGFLGGSFNPMHIGHLSTTYQVYKKFSLSQIYLIPSGFYSHKKLKNLRDISCRSRTIFKSLPSISFLKVSKVELIRSGKTYTIDTISYFNFLFKRKYELYLILGVDAFFDIHLWKKYEIILEIVKVIIVSRHFSNLLKKNDLLKKIDRYIDRKLYLEYDFYFYKNNWVGNKIKGIYLFEINSPGLSSSSIKFLLKKNNNLNFILPPISLHFIKKKGLYV